MQANLEKIAELVKGKVVGEKSLIVKGVAGIKEAEEGDITFLAFSKYAKELEKTKATAIVVSKIPKNCEKPLIIVENPLYSFSLIVSFFHEKPRPNSGVHSNALIGENVKIGKDSSIAPFVTIGDRVKIGNKVTIYPNVYIGYDSEIGDNSIVYPNVTVMQRVSIQKRVIIHSGTVIGSDGYGYVPHKGKHHKIPQVGTILIEDDVEIGANVSVDRAALGKTIIRRGTKIDNLVQIAHNVSIGENCLIVSQVGISGSSELGNNVILAGQVGVVDHVKIGDNSLVGAQTGVHKNVEPNQKILGSPFRAHGEFLRINATLTKLPEMRKQITDQEKKIKDLEKRLFEKEQKSN